MKTSILVVLVAFLIYSANATAMALYAGWAVGDHADGYGTILRTSNSGGTWTRQGAPGVIADVDLRSVVAVDRYTAWVVGDSGSIYHTTNGGNTWKSKGPAWAANIDLAKVHTMDGRRVWIVGNNLGSGEPVILHTDDGGVTWTNQMPAGYGNVGGLQGVFTPDGVNVWVGGGPSHQDGDAFILKSSNGGQSWTRQTGSGVTQTEHILGISAVDEMHAWAAGNSGNVLHTTDGGASWVRQDNAGMGIKDNNEIDMVSNEVIWVAFDHGIFWTTDGGSSWDNSGNYGHFSKLATMGISAVSAQEAWSSVWAHSDQGTGTVGTIWHTGDGGQTWKQQGPENVPGLWTISMSNIPLPPVLQNVPVLGMLGLFSLSGLLVLAAAMGRRYS
jgi:photosystem II stability/assembly factor-like uncharacterized protein